MNEKLGPLPRWAWILLAGGTIGAVYLLKRSKASTGTTGEPIPELAGQALPAEGQGGGGAAGNLGAPEAKDSAEAEALRQEVNFLTEHAGVTSSGSGLGAGIGEVLEAKEGLEKLGLIAPASQTRVEPSAAAASPVKAATGKQASFPLTSSRGAYRDTHYRGMAAHEYSGRVHGGVGPRGNIIVIGGPAKVGHAAPGSHAPAHASKPPAHHTAAKPRKAVAHHAPPAHHAPAPPKHVAAPVVHPANGGGGGTHFTPEPAHHAPPPPRRPAPRKPAKRRR